MQPCSAWPWSFQHVLIIMFWGICYFSSWLLMVYIVFLILLLSFHNDSNVLYVIVRTVIFYLLISTCCVIHWWCLHDHIVVLMHYTVVTVLMHLFLKILSNVSVFVSLESWFFKYCCDGCGLNMPAVPGDQPSCLATCNL